MAWVSDPDKGIAARSDRDDGPVPHGRVGNQVVTEVRQRTHQEGMGQRGPKGDPLYAIRRLLLVGENGSAPLGGAVSTRPWRIPMVTSTTR